MSTGPQAVPDYSGDFHSSTQKVAFAYVPEDVLRAIMHDTEWPQAMRVLVWVIVYSWRAGSWYAIDAMGAPLFQSHCSKELGIDKRVLSKIVKNLVYRGYLIDHPKLLYASISPTKGPQPKVASASDFFTKFVENYKVARAADFQQFEVAYATVQRWRKDVWMDYRKALKEEKKRQKVAGAGVESGQQATDSTLLKTTNTKVRTYVPAENGDSPPPAAPEPGSVEAQILDCPWVKAAEQKVKDTLREPLLGRLAAKLRDAETPVSWLDTRIQNRFHKITSLGFLATCADDAVKAWKTIQAGAPAAPAITCAKCQKPIEPGESVINGQCGDCFILSSA